MITILMAQIGLGPIGVGNAIENLIVCVCLFAMVALGLGGITWVVTAIRRRRYGLHELLFFVGYWAVVFAFAHAILK